MKKLLILFSYHFITSCVSDSSVINNIKTFEEVSQIILSEKRYTDHSISLDSIKILYPEITSQITFLESELELSEIEVYNIGGETIKKGIAYRLNFGGIETYKQLLYVVDEINKEEFVHYEQFLECANRKDINDKWTLVTITKCFD
ncbi:hypothetical protein V9L05_07165 [Bernardetia sp. Wsw4-3y2]|uniref:hypothetical protein n=1 Tax=Bernardetia sp. Wsw4-3y2 TaxID=3127471 RepID=UPI0030D288C9